MFRMTQREQLVVAFLVGCWSAPAADERTADNHLCINIDVLQIETTARTRSPGRIWPAERVHILSHIRTMSAPAGSWDPAGRRLAAAINRCVWNGWTKRSGAM